MAKTPTRALRDQRDAERRTAVLDALREGASAAEAAQAGGTTRQSVHRWRQADEAFAIAYHDAEEQGTDTLETVARKRAVEGSDTLLIFLLKARRPQKYRDSVHVQHSGSIASDESALIQAAAQRDPDAFARIAKALGAAEA